MFRFLKRLRTKDRRGITLPVLEEYLADYFKTTESRLDSLEALTEETRKRAEANRRKLFREEQVVPPDNGAQVESAEPDLASIIGSLRPGDPIPVKYLHLF